MDDLAKKMRAIDIEYRNKPTLLLRAYNNTRTCVIVVDMLEGFCREGALASPNNASIIEPIATTLDYLENAHKLFVCDNHEMDSTEFNTFPPHCHTKKECTVVSELSKHARTIVHKKSTNAIFALTNMLNASDYDNFLIMGCCTDICVLQLSTSLKAILNEGRINANVIVFSEYCSTYDSADHPSDLMNNAAFKCMEAAGVKVFRKLV